MITRDIIYDINALQQNVSVDKYFDSANEQSTPSFKNNFTDAVSPESMQDGKLLADISSADYEAGLSGWIIKANGDVEFNDGDFRGNVEVGSIDIGGTDSSSAHIDADGNFWLGSATYATAPARISKEGYAVFENVAIGGDTIQYVITNSGIFSFGDGSDGNATCDGSTAVAGMSRSGSTYTMTRDVYFGNFTINSGITVNTSGYRIFVKDTCTISGTVHRNGVVGSNGGNAVGGGFDNPGIGGAGGVLADGYLKGGTAGATGGNGGTAGGSPAAGSAGNNTSNCLGGNGSTGQAGGNTGGTAGVGGTATASNVKLIANWHLATLLDISTSGATVKFTPAAGSGSGGGGKGAGGGSGQPGGGGAGGGSSGGIVAIYARNLIITSTGVVSANGGDGGIGGDGWSPNGGNGGGGPGGNGGILVLVYNSISNQGTLTVNGGTAGVGGGVGGSGKTKVAIDGAVGLIYQFELSL